MMPLYIARGLPPSLFVPVFQHLLYLESFSLNDFNYVVWTSFCVISSADCISRASVCVCEGGYLYKKLFFCYQFKKLVSV